MKTTIADFDRPRGNTRDEYQWMTNEEILKDLEDKRHNFSILLCNISRDINIGSAVRSHATFLGQDIILYGHKRYNRIPAVGTYAYSLIKHLKYVEDIDDVLGAYDEVIGCDFVPDRSVSIWNSTFDYEKRTLFCFGHEEEGLPEELMRRCHRLLHIPMFGATKSFNVAVSAALVLNEYVRGLHAGK
ncbi:MAG TPA: TrmH family RNA methyltransferase [Armatimonadaceae bacterium]|jgi:tRNA G18 (ribose-2'-O)-methylase SpoU|nr:TrmH family RNA methyltransferase [Armatimonadaceae bacterium]